MTDSIKNNLISIAKYVCLILLFLIIDLTLRDHYHERAFVGIVIAVLLLQFSKKLFYVYVIPNLILFTLYLPNRLQSGAINYNSVLSVKYTNSMESIEYLQNIPLIYYIITLLFLILSIVIIRFDFKRMPKGITYLLLAFLLVLGVKNARNFIKYGLSEKTTSPFFSHSFYPSAAFAYKIHTFKEQIEEKENILNAEYDKKWNITHQENKKEIYVVVIGESARKDFMNCYGFPVNNTPFASSSPQIRFENYLSVASSTLTCLTRTLCFSDSLSYYNKYKNIISLAYQADMQTVWLSNQGSLGKHDLLVSTIGRLAEKSVFLNEGEFNTKSYLDSLLLPPFRETIQEAQPPVLIILHLMGSHPRLSDRTNHHYDTFYKTEELSYYVQSIKNTDYILEQIHQKLKETHKSFSLVYFSDHGLSITKEKLNKEYTIKHSDQFKECYNVPLIVWGDDITETRTIDAYRYSNDFLFLISELMGIELGEKKHSVPFISSDVFPNEQKLLNFDQEQIEFNQLKSNPVS